MRNLTVIRRMFAMLTFAGALLIAGCEYDDTELKTGISDLNDRVTKLEEAAKQAQQDIASLKTLVDALKNAVTVSSVVENSDGSYTINFSDGTTATIRNGRDGQNGQDGQNGHDGQDGQDGKDGITPPTITVVEENGDYYWIYRQPDGSTSYVTGPDGEKIKANGGAAPQVRINPETNEWEISSDGGATWTSTGVKATGPAGEQPFESVTFDDEYVYVTLAGGTRLTLVRAAELSFAFAVEQLVFYHGEERSAAVEMKGVEKVSIARPEGWRATLTDGALKITAPVAENSFAEQEGEITVVAVAANGQSVIAGLKVKVVLPAKVGDYLYDDGSWSDGGLVSIDADGLNPVWAAEKPAPIAGKRVIGIVFQIAGERMTQSEREAGYRGYAMAVKAAHGSEKVTTWWGCDWNFSCLKAAKLASTWYNNVNGYVETHTVKENYPTDLATKMPAFDLVLNHFSLPAPASTSGWFLPSTGQLWDMVANLAGGEAAAVMKEWQTFSYDATRYCSERVSYDALARLNASMEKVPAEDKEPFERIDERHNYASVWASTPYDSETACQMNIGTDGLIECMCDWYDGDASARPIIAF